MSELFTTIIFIYGLVFGSFYNVCIVRIPKGKSIISPRSHCPKCLDSFPWYLNIPLLSYLYLKGKCRRCSLPIGIVYPFIELLTGVMAVLLWIKFCSVVSMHHITLFIIYFYFSSTLLISSVIDLRYFIIPDRFSKGSIVLGILISSIYPKLHGFEQHIDGFVYSMVSSFICFWSLNAIRLLASFIYGREAMGYGDIKLMGAFGAFMGWKLGLLSLFFGSISGSLAGILMILLNRLKKSHPIPFGPCLAFGAYISLIWGYDFIKWYNSFVLIRF